MFEVVDLYGQYPDRWPKCSVVVIVDVHNWTRGRCMQSSNHSITSDDIAGDDGGCSVGTTMIHKVRVLDVNAA